MLYRNLMFSLRETIFSIVLQDSDTPKHPSECFLNLPCGCSNPGKELQCEDCPYLEACISRFKTVRGLKRTSKLRITTNTKT